MLRSPARRMSRRNSSKRTVSGRRSDAGSVTRSFGASCGRWGSPRPGMCAEPSAAWASISLAVVVKTKDVSPRVDQVATIGALANDPVPFFLKLRRRLLEVPHMQVNRRPVVRERTRNGLVGLVQGDRPADRGRHGPHPVHASREGKPERVAIQPHGGVHVSNLEDEVSNVLNDRHQPGIDAGGKSLSIQECPRLGKIRRERPMISSFGPCRSTTASTAHSDSTYTFGRRPSASTASLRFSSSANRTAARNVPKSTSTFLLIRTPRPPQRWPSPPPP